MNKLATLATLGVVAAAVAAPSLSPAQTQRELERRQQKKNEWRNIAIGSAAIGAYGLLKGDRTIGLAGLAGAAYGAHRYEQDRKSQNRMENGRRYYQQNNRYRQLANVGNKSKKQPKGKAVGYHRNSAHARR